jgi:pimeloyl-ACP methyl ester carboxylesterase
VGFFADPLHEQFASWILGFAPYGGGDVGEVAYLATQVAEGDDGSFFEAFSGYAQRLIVEGDAAEASGRRATAQECFVRAAAFLGTAFRPLFGTPVDPRLVEASRRQAEALRRGLTLFDPPGEPLEITYERTTLPGWFLRAPSHPDEVRPTVIVGGGWDSSMVDNLLGIGVAALQRGYHVVLFDGPGQGQVLVEQGLTLRHDWEAVVTPVVDVALTLDLVDPDRLVYEPWSLGGYFAPRVAAYEHRLAAIVCDPGQIDVGGKLVDALRMMGLDDAAVARLPDLDPAFAEGATTFMRSDRTLNWSMLRRGFWTNGASDFASFLAEMLQWKLSPEQVAQIRCPTLVTSADGDRASSNAQDLYDALTAPKARIHFTSDQGVGMHCEMLNRSLANRRILDWLDDTLGVRG